MVEFALVIPIFFVFVLGLVEFGRGLMVSSLISNATRVGCRTGILSGSTNDQVTSAIDSLLHGQGIAGYTTTITVNGKAVNVSTAQSADTVTVQISIPITSASWLPSLSFLSGSLSAQFSMPHE
jgi:Flp pilus assembly protein TadG